MYKCIAMYLRLSLDDDKTGESNSIINQRNIIKEYMLSTKEFHDVTVVEFQDDGYSGTNYNRPGIKRLLEAVGRKEIDCIIVKDLSRFGRDYVKTGNFLEILFPYVGVRFIAINDNYDSNNYKGTTPDIDFSLRNVLNALYSRDISKKIKSAKQTQALQGKYINAFAAYGYKKAENNKYHIVIDEPAAETVRYIFMEYCGGTGPSQIANILNTNGILSPSAYKKMNGCKLEIRNVTGEIWSSGSVSSILRDERYIGTLISGKEEAGKLGSGKRIYKPKKEWIRIPNSHPAIISSEIWEASVRKRESFCNPSYNFQKVKNRVLYKKIYCGYCGHLLRYRTDINNGYYYCQTPKHSEKYGCLSKGYREQEVVGIIMSAIQPQVKALFDMKEFYKNINALRKKNSFLKATALKIDKKINKLQALKLNLYKQFKSGEINETEYSKERLNADDVINELEIKRNQLFLQSNDQLEIVNDDQEFLDLVFNDNDKSELSDKMLNILVARVNIYDIDRIQIIPVFGAELNDVLLGLK